MKSVKLQLLSLIMLAALQGCGSKANNGLSSNNNSQGNVVALSCNRYNGTELSIRLNIDPVDSNNIYVSFLSNPTIFSSQAGTIKFLAGTESTLSNNSYVGYTVHNGFQQISGWNPPGSLVTQNFLNALNSNQTLPLNNVRFRVQVGPATNSTIIRMVLETTSQVVEVATMLIPSFDANPNTYATNHSAALLNLHPLLSYKNQNWTSDQFRQQGEFICNQ